MDVPDFVDHDGHIWKRVYQRVDRPPLDLPRGRDMLRVTYAWPWDSPDPPEWPTRKPAKW